jgi:hypothetical protein
MKEQNQEQRPKKKTQNSKNLKIIMKPIKKPQYPNWEHQEIVCLVQAKRDEPIASWDVVNFKDCFESVVMKWKKVSMTMMGVDHNTHMRYGPTCKEKWVTMHDCYK